MNHYLEEASALNKCLEGLTPTQTQAVTHGQGPMMIVAGAGTGKTTVITRRIVHLVASGTAQSSQILALTFTNKAAAEMQERVDVMLPYGYADIRICTFHSFGDRLLREYAMELGLNPKFKVLSQPEQVLFLRDKLYQLPLDRYRPAGQPTQHLSNLVAHFSKLKDEDRSPHDYLEFAEGLVAAAGDDEVLQDRAAAHLELARCYEVYQALMKEAGYLDFGDQVYLTLRMLRERPAVARRLQDQYQYLLVDEFQDTNYAQFALVKVLAARHRNLTVVGDDDQSIYQFRGAALSNVLEFTDCFPEARQVVLRKNFRSTQLILDAAYRCIVHNNPDRLEVKNGIDKQLVAAREPGQAEPTIEFSTFDKTSSEADAVATHIAELVGSGVYGYGDMAILVRVNRDADPYLRSLNMRQIPFRFTGNRGLYHRPEVRLLISFLRCAADPQDSISHYHLASSGLFAVDQLALALLSSYASRRNQPLRRAMELHSDPLYESDELLELDDPCRESLAEFLGFLDLHIQLIAEQSPGQILYQFLNGSGLMQNLLEENSNEAEIKVQNIARFFEVIKVFENLFPGAQLPQFVHHLELLMEAGDSPATVEADAGTDAVEILTVHKSKGLEFPVVFLVGLSEDRFPARQRYETLEFPSELARDAEAGSKERHLGEERRLFYVALTRAKERLFLSNAADIGSRRLFKVSRFVLEALDRPRADLPHQKTSALEALKQFELPVQVEQKWSQMDPGRVLNVSFRKIDDYLTCPLKYKYTQVLRIPIVTHHSVVYGNALHLAISFYLERKRDGQATDLEELLTSFEQAWVSEGFLTREHEEQRHQAGVEALTRFYQLEEENPQPPWLVEKEFAFFVGRNRVRGRWDRVDKSEDGRVVLTDYKSASVRTQFEADRRARESLQLAVYTMAFENAEGKMPHQVRLYFLESGLVGRAAVSRARLTEVEELIRGCCAGIRARDYTPTPSPRVCGSCAYREICPAGS